MAKRGRPPKSPEQKRLEGNPGNREIIEPLPEVDVSSGSLRMPTRLSVDERVVWRETLDAFPDWYFTQADKVPLMAYCRSVVRLEKSEQALKNKSAVSTRGTGAACRNPHIDIVNLTLAQIHRLRDELGISREKRKHAQLMRTPAEVGVPTPSDASPADGDDPDDFGDLVLRPRFGRNG